MRTPRLQSGHLALAVSAVALFTVAGGPAQAAGVLNGKSIKSKSIAGSKLKNNAITGAKIKDGSVGANDLARGSVTSAKLSADLLRTLSGAGAARIVSTIDLADDSVTTPKLADAAVTTPKLADDAVTAPKVADDAINSANVLVDSLAAVDLAPASVGTSEIQNGSVNTDDVQNAGLGAVDIGNVGTTLVNRGNIAAHACEIVTVNPGLGSIANDIVILTPETNFAGPFNYQAEVDATTFDIKICNNSAAAADPDAGGAEFNWTVIRR